MRGRLVLGAIVGALLLSATVRGGDAATVTAGIGLNLRACPALDCNVYTVMPYGSWADIVSGPDANGWYQVNYGGTVGYAYGGWLADAESAEPQWAQGNEPAPAPVPVAPVPATGYQATVYAAAATYGVSGDWLWAVHGCETGYTYRHDLWGPNGEYGPFQFHASTFATFASMSGIGGSIYDPVAQAYVTAWAFANGYSSHWACS